MDCHKEEQTTLHFKPLAFMNEWVLMYERVLMCQVVLKYERELMYERVLKYERVLMFERVYKRVLMYKGMNA